MTALQVDDIGGQMAQKNEPIKLMVMSMVFKTDANGSEI